MTTKTKAKGPASTTRQPKRITWVWGDAKKGIAVVRSFHRKGGKFWYDIHHVKDRKVTHVARDHSTKAEAIREAKGYARRAESHPRRNVFFGE